MAKMTRLGELERAVMDHLWSSAEPQTVRQVHEELSAHRDLAYTTIMTVLQRLAKKNLVVQHRDVAARPGAELVRASVPAASIETALNAYEKVSPEKDQLTCRIRADDRHMGEALLGMLDLLETNLGKWKYDAERKKVRFDDDATLDKYIALREQMEFAAQEQKRLQARLLELATQ